MKNNFPLYVIIGILVIVLVATNITDVDVSTVRGDLNNMSAQLTEQAMVTVTPTATTAPTEAPAQQPTSCELDKIGTWSEISSAGPQRIEVGGHGVQQLDFYPLKGVKSISYIVPAIAPNEIPAIYYGYGSIWEGQLPACANFDFVADATNYAQPRLDSGHSGLVIDLRGGQFKVVANTANMSQKDIDALLAQHMAAMDPTK